MSPRLLRRYDLPLDPEFARALATYHPLPVEVGQSFGQAVGLAWAVRGDADPVVVVVAAAEELHASVTPALAAFAMGQRLARLVVVAIADDDHGLAAADEVRHELTLRGFVAESIAPAQLTAALRRCQDRGRPSLLVCRTTGNSQPTPVPSPHEPPPFATRTPLPLAFEGRGHEIGAFALGVALHGRFAPIAVVPIAEADAVKPALRAFARLGLPGLYYVTEDRPPDDVLWSLRLCTGVDVWRPADVDEASGVFTDWLTTGGVRVIAVGPEAAPFDSPVPSDLKTGAAVIVDVESPDLCLVATGSEVTLAVTVQGHLQAPARVVAVPSVERFVRLPEVTRRRLLGSGNIVILEAGVAPMWRALYPAACIVSDAAELTPETVLIIIECHLKGLLPKRGGLRR